MGAHIKTGCKIELTRALSLLRIMLKILLLSVFHWTTILATPPACFLSCINEVAHYCPGSHHDLLCLCQLKESLVGCLVDICPVGNFEASRDHFIGTCLEHGRPHDPVRHAIPPEQYQEYFQDFRGQLPSLSHFPMGTKVRSKTRIQGLMRQGTPEEFNKDGSVIDKRDTPPHRHRTVDRAKHSR